MSRAFLVVMDSVGCGGAPDAKGFGDEGANTLGNILLTCDEGGAEIGRKGALYLPNLTSLGLGSVLQLSTGNKSKTLTEEPKGLWGVAREQSLGKDTPTGHWELCGVILPWEWHYFTNKEVSFPKQIIDLIKEESKCDGVLGNCHASGIQIIEKFAAQHLITGWPICYTSADSVLQIAAHEESYGLERLRALCSKIAPDLHAMKVGRVIARPFVGNVIDGFTRTINRQDFSFQPPSETLCDWAFKAGREVNALGKISDIFPVEGMTSVGKGSDKELMLQLNDLLHYAGDGSLNLINFVEFDSLYGHRRDVAGYARHLEWFDFELTNLLKKVKPDDLIIFTADHGNDPTWMGIDHTREQVPVLGVGAGIKAIGQVNFIDVAASIACFLGIKNKGNGVSFL